MIDIVPNSCIWQNLYAKLAAQLLSKSSGLFDRAVDKESPAKEREMIIMEQWHRRQKKFFVRHSHKSLKPGNLF